MKRLSRVFSLTAIAILLLAEFDSHRVVAQDEVNGAASAVQPLSSEEVDRLIPQLDAAEFEVREAASKRLAQGGAAVVPAIERAAETDNLEIASRCVGILKELYEGDDEDARTEATIALKRLADAPNASIARRAKAVIAPPEPENPFENGPGGVRINMRGFPQGGGNVRVQSTNNNGQIEVDVREGDRQIHISHRNGKNIAVKVTEPPIPGNKERQTTEYKARDQAELKKKHPEAGRLFETYGNQGNIQVFGGAFPPGAVPPEGAIPNLLPRNLRRGFPRQRGGVAPNFPNFINPRKMTADLEAVGKQLDQVAARLKELAQKGEAKPDELNRLADEVARVQEAVAKARNADDD
ncbi:MAG: hypothetical protein EHM42_09940 [Planctomycetaceae bacterium]|nr:MAG: hypothetical protein EHM42_09940 [Planctomycetaceae bacterium]